MALIQEEMDKLNIDKTVKQRVLDYYALAAECRKTVINNIQSNINAELDSIPTGIITEYLQSEGISQPTINFSSFLLGLSNELLFKCLYVLNEYETLERDFKNPHISTEGCSNLCDYCFKKARNEYSGVNDLNSKFDSSFVPNNRPRNNNPIVVTATDSTAQETLAGKNNGHQLYYLLENIQDKSIVDLIKYETIMFSSKRGVLDINFPKTKDFIQASELMSILKSFDPEAEMKKYNKDMITNSPAFEGDRYFERLSEIKDGLFLNASICATHEIFCYILNKKVFNTEYNNNNSSAIRDKRKLIEDIDNKKELTAAEIDILVNNNNFEIYDLARVFKYLNIKEIKGILEGYDSFKKISNRTLSQYFNYFIFIKTYVKETYELFDKETIPNVSKFFERIIKTNDISNLGEQYRNWFNSIDIKKLTDKEYAIINNIDPEYIYNSLSITEKIVYLKLKEVGFSDVQFKLYGNKLYISFIDNFLSASTSLDNLDKLIKLSKVRNMPFDYVIKWYDEFGEDIFDKYLSILKDKTSSCIIPFWYNRLGKDKFDECLKISKTKKVSFYDVVVWYEKLGEDKFDSYQKIAEVKSIPFNEVAKWYDELGEDKFDSYQKIAEAKSIPFNEVAQWYDELGEDKFDSYQKIAEAKSIPFNEVARMSEELGEIKFCSYLEILEAKSVSFRDAENFYDEFGKEKFSSFLEDLKSQDTSTDYVNFLNHNLERAELDKFFGLFKIDLYEESKDAFNKYLKISKAKSIPFNEVAEWYEKLGEDKFDSYQKIAEVKSIPFNEVAKWYDELGEEKFDSYQKIAEAKSIPFNEVAEWCDELGEDIFNKYLEILNRLKMPLLYRYEGNLQQIKDAVEKIEVKDLFTIDDIKLEKNMLVLSEERILRNLILLKGSVGNYIFYKTPEQIEEIQKLCQDKNIDFKNEFLYFDMDYLNDNIVNISIILNKQIKFEIDNDVEFFVKRVKEIVDADKYKKQGERMLNYLEHINSAVPSFTFNKSKNDKEKQVQ